MTLWIAVIAAAALFGALLLAVGLRGKRIDDHPVCRRCRFDLAGLSIGAPDARCPECGRDLTSRRAIRIGRRRKRGRVIAVGASLLLIALGVGGAVGWPAASRFNWNTIKPVWLLRVDARSADRDRAEGALDELVRRWDQGGLSPDALRDLAAEGLLIHADRKSPWRWQWGRLIVDGWDEGLVADEKLEQFLRRGLENVATLSARDEVSIADPWPFRVGANAPRLTSRSSLSLSMSIEEVRINGREVQVEGRRRHSLRLGAAGGWGNLVEPPPDAEPGEQVISVRWTISVIDSESPDESVLTVTGVKQDKFTALPADTATIELIDDPSLEDDMRAAIEARPLRVRRDDDGRLRARSHLVFHGLPVGVAADLFIRAQGREWRLGGVARDPSNVNSGSWIWNYTPGLAADSVDLVLRPNRDSALWSYRMRRMWNREIVIEDVPVKREAAP